MTDSLLDAITSADFVGWSGLPPAGAPDDLFDDFPADLTGMNERPLGSSFEPAVFVVLDIAGYYRPKASIRDGKLVLFDGRPPELKGGLDRLLDDLGDPDARLDYYFNSLELREGEWVFAERGITLFLSEEHDRAFHVALYQATDLDTYTETLAPHLRKKMRPRPPR